MNAQPDPRVPAYLGRILDSGGNPAGTCFQLRPGLLITAHHVLESLGAVTEGDVVNVDALAGGGAPFPATVATTAPLHDLAVLKTTAPTLGASVPGAAPTDAMVAGEPVLVTGATHVEDSYTYRFLDALGSWQGATTRDDAIPLGRLEAKAVMKGMSGAPVRRKADDVVVGIVSGRYNSADDWLRNSVWVARTEDLQALLKDIAPLDLPPPRRGAVDLTLTVDATRVHLRGAGQDVAAPHDGVGVGLDAAVDDARAARARLGATRGQGAPFTFRTEPLVPGDQRRLEAAKAASAQRWGRPRAEVEEEMVARHRGHLTVVR